MKRLSTVPARKRGSCTAILHSRYVAKIDTKEIHDGMFINNFNSTGTVLTTLCDGGKSQKR